MLEDFIAGSKNGDTVTTHDILKGLREGLINKLGVVGVKEGNEDKVGVDLVGEWPCAMGHRVLQQCAVHA